MVSHSLMWLEHAMLSGVSPTAACKSELQSWTGRQKQQSAPATAFPQQLPPNKGMSRDQNGGFHEKQL